MQRDERGKKARLCPQRYSGSSQVSDRVPTVASYFRDAAVADVGSDVLVV